MAKSPKTRSSRVFTISFPEPLAKQVVAVAKDENRNISELFREAFRGYAVEKRHRVLEAARTEAARRGPILYTEDDVEALVDEIRARGYERRKKTA
jgi:metal-responsive CopG/Arc/MetJ family transcriptional regulator